MTDHDPRCERSATDPKRCRCQCNGRHHGELASPIDLIPPESNLSIHHWFEARMATHRDAALAEGVPL